MGWFIRTIGTEIHIRLPRLPGMRLDLTRTEAVALVDSLCVELSLPPAKIVRQPWYFRLQDWWALTLWRLSPRARKDARTRAQAALDNPWSVP